jgi:hypothetical protein
MRKLIQNKILISFLFIIAGCSVLQAKIFTAGGGIGLGSPTYPVLFQDFYGQGIGCSGVLKCNFLSHTSIVFTLSYQTIRSDLDNVTEEIEDRLDQPYTVESLDSKGFVTGLVSLNILQYLQQKGKSYRFYLTAGGGYGFKRVHETKMELFLGYSDEIKFDPKDGYQTEINGGLGFEIGLNDKMCFYIQGLYHYLFTDEIEFYNPQKGTIESIRGGTSLIITSIGFLVDL